MQSKKEWSKLMCLAGVVALMGGMLPAAGVMAEEYTNVLDPSAPSGEALPDFGASSMSLETSTTSTTGLPILFFRDYVVGDGIFDDALINLGLSGSVTFTDNPTTFADKLDDQAWGCVIVLNQNYGSTDYFATQLADHVTSGGRAIFADWTVNFSGKDDLYSAFEVSGTGDSNGNQRTIYTDTHRIWSGVPTSVSLDNPGWGRWSFGLSALGGGVPTGSFPNGDAAIVIGNNGATAFNGFLSDTFSNHAEGVRIAENEINAICFPTIPVTIDIKPGSDENSINLCSNGAVPVAILGSDTFDVNDINTDSLRLADAAVKVVGKKDPHTLCSTEDVNTDGYDDLVCHFNTTELGNMLDGTSTSATVKGETVEGTPIEGSDSITIVKEDC